MNDPLLNIAIEAVRMGADLILEARRDIKHISIDEKNGPTDLVTEVDRAVQQSISELLLEKRPTDQILGEECEPDSVQTYDSGVLWVLDPLDGTTNFVHGFPHFAISLACLENGRLRVGVIMNPVSGELFSACKGRGAQLNDHIDNLRLRTSGRQQLTGALLANSSHGNPEHAIQHDNLATHRDLYKHGLTVRRTGSVALDLAYVAAGRLDGFWGSGLKVWDVSAGALLISEAGGILCDYLGGEDYLYGETLACGTPACLKQMMASIYPHVTRRDVAPPARE